MSLEQALQENTEAVRALLAALQGVNAISTAVETADAPATEGKRRGRPPKSETASAPSAPAEPAAPTTPPSATTAPSAEAQVASASAPKPSDTSFDDVTKKIVELNKAKGRETVVGVITHFLGADAIAAGKKVPDLAALGKNAEILAHVEGLLSPSDDLGI